MQSEVRICSENELSQAISQQTMPGMLEHLIAQGSTAKIVDTEGAVYTYKDLQEQARNVAAWILAELGDAHVPVVILTSRGYSYLVSIFAVLYSGKIVVPLDAAHPEQRLKKIVEDCQARLIITEKNLAPMIHSLSEGDVPMLLLEEIAATSLNLTAPILRDATENAFILYTSGSSGMPKGVVHTQQSLLFDARKFAATNHITTHDHISHLLSPSVIGGIREITSALLSGACLHIFDMKTTTLTDLAYGLRREEITVCRLVPSLMRSLLHHLPEQRYFPSMRLLYVGGEPMFPVDAMLAQQKLSHQCDVVNIYGATETGLCSQFTVVERKYADTVPVGKSFPHYRLYLLDDSGREIVEPNVQGQIVVESPFLSQGYWNRSDLTDHSFQHRSGRRCYFTGDIGRWNEDGDLEHLGRFDGQVQIRGNRVELAEVENVLLSCSDLGNVAVVEQRRGHDALIVAFAVASRSISAAELRRLCEEQLPDFAVPTEFHFLDALPRTVQGKVDRKALTQLRPCEEAKISLTTQLSQVQAQLIQFCQELLHVETIDPDSCFYEHGGDSLKAMVLLGKIEDTWSVRLNPFLLSKRATLRDIASHLEQSFASPDSQRHITLYFLHGVVGGTQHIKALSERLAADINCVGLDAPEWIRHGSEPIRFETLAEHHAREICRRQPIGPYSLSGYSFGGVLAFEVARQLVRGGNKVDFVGMIDCFLPLRLRSVPLRKKILPLCANLPSWGIDYVRNGSSRSSVIAPQHKQRSADTGELTQQGEQAQRSVEQALGSVPPLLRAQSQRLLNAIDNYIPESFDGHLTLFNARVRPLLHSHRVAPIWAEVTGARVTEIIVPGNHATILREPYVDELAARFIQQVRKHAAVSENPPL